MNAVRCWSWMTRDGRFRIIAPLHGRRRWSVSPALSVDVVAVQWLDSHGLSKTDFTRLRDAADALDAHYQLDPLPPLLYHLPGRYVPADRDTGRA